MRQALIVGIDDYPGDLKLSGCIKDAESVFELISRNGDGSTNFNTRLLVNIRSKLEFKNALTEFFRCPSDVSFFYFSGHGIRDFLGYHLATPDLRNNDWGVEMNQLFTVLSKSPAKNKVVILDCCHSGGIGMYDEINLNNRSVNLYDGVAIIASSSYDQHSSEVNDRGVFTNLFIEALKGGAGDLNGDISIGNVYTYIDKAMQQNWQRPVFKANVSGFVTLRKVNQSVREDIIRKLPVFFANPNDEYPLDPSFEYSNDPIVKHEYILPYSIGENVEKFGQLQKLFSIGLIVPVGAGHMYYAAMESKACKLTPLGQHYWRLAKDGLI